MLTGEFGSTPKTRKASTFHSLCRKPRRRWEVSKVTSATTSARLRDADLRGWVSLDGNFWWGGIASVFGVPNPKTTQTSSRIGASFSFPYSKHQSIKMSYSAGTYSRFGGSYQNVQVAWQYSWIGTRW